jgi:hypothetical protein
MAEKKGEKIALKIAKGVGITAAAVGARQLAKDIPAEAKAIRQVSPRLGNVKLQAEHARSRITYIRQRGQGGASDKERIRAHRVRVKAAERGVKLGPKAALGKIQTPPSRVSLFQGATGRAIKAAGRVGKVTGKLGAAGIMYHAVSEAMRMKKAGERRKKGLTPEI